MGRRAPTPQRRDSGSSRYPLFMQTDELLTSVSGTGPVRRLEIRYRLKVPIHSVWNAITRIDEVRHWWTGGLLEEKEGGF